MADEAARRRELRRQKILQNSESRLKRILKKEGSNGCVDDKLSSPDSLNASAAATSFAQSNPISSMDFSEIPNEEYSGMFGVHDCRQDSPSSEIPSLRETGGSRSMASASVEPEVSLAAELDFYSTAAGPQRLYADSLDDILSRNSLAFSGVSSSNFSKSFGDNGLADGDININLFGLNRECEDSATVSSQDNSGRSRKFWSFEHVWNPCHPKRIFLIVFIAFFYRLVLPIIPFDYALLFGPLYYVELMSLPLFVVYGTPWNRSPIDFLCRVLLLVGVRPGLVYCGRKITSCVNAFICDFGAYTFAFFLVHACCQQFNMFSVH